MSTSKLALNPLIRARQTRCLVLVNFKETKKFGPLEIKILKCGKVKVNNMIDDVAYMQVKDLTKNENETRSSYRSPLSRDQVQKRKSTK